ncbi:MAG: DEAD/DEAH box helicase [Bacteroidales bacterium]|nr:DEAD/DEAH box helicase [Bacteroidales bacterium]MCD8394137.1 DEAD/DEAH box helicase [Bacteroidales bacterium]
MKKDEIIQRARKTLGIHDLNPMQQALAADNGRETILLAPTGSGKTLAFDIPLLLSIRQGAQGPQAVILAPSRELVVQIAAVTRPLALPMRVVPLYGGHSMTDETRSLEASPAIIVATPGRLLDHANRGTVDLSRVKTLVIDEYDKQLELGFHDQMRRLVRKMTAVNRMILTSATPLEEIPDWLKLRSPRVHDFTERNVAPQGHLDYYEMHSPSPDKLDSLKSLLASFPADKRSIVFVNHRESAERVHQALTKAGFHAALYHGALDQLQREIAVDRLNNGSAPVLVATDLAARGLDIADVDAIIHYHLPLQSETFTHRNGRTARQGADGEVYIITSDKDDRPQWLDEGITYRSVGDLPAAGRCPQTPRLTTLYFNAGRREKISRGDIAGYLIHKGQLAPDEVGVITVKDHCALAAVPRDKVMSLVATLQPHRLKNQRVRVSEL